MLGPSSREGSAASVESIALLPASRAPRVVRDTAPPVREAALPIPDPTRLTAPVAKSAVDPATLEAVEHEERAIKPRESRQMDIKRKLMKLWLCKISALCQTRTLKNLRPASDCVGFAAFNHMKRPTIAALLLLAIGALAVAVHYFQRPESDSSLRVDIGTSSGDETQNVDNQQSTAENQKKLTLMGPEKEVVPTLEKALPDLEVTVPLPPEELPGEEVVEREPLEMGPWEPPEVPETRPGNRVESKPNTRAYASALSAIQRFGLKPKDVPVLAVIDMTQPSFERRLLIYNHKTRKITRHLVAHGKNSGNLYATSFSNTAGSSKSCCGLFKVGERYNGKHGLSIRLNGLEDGLNNKAYGRAIVIHPAWYVSYLTVLENISVGLQPRIGRSRGCPAVSKADADAIYRVLQPGTYLYIYANPAPSAPKLTQTG